MKIRRPSLAVAVDVGHGHKSNGSDHNNKGDDDEDNNDDNYGHDDDQNAAQLRGSRSLHASPAQPCSLQQR